MSGDWYAEELEKKGYWPEKVISTIDPSETRGMLSAELKKNLPTLLKELEDYIQSTYGAHYGDNVQLFDVWESTGIARTMFMGDISKYALRYGRKDGHSKKDLMKIFHYTLLLLQLDHGQNQETGTREANGYQYPKGMVPLGDLPTDY